MDGQKPTKPHSQVMPFKKWGLCDKGVWEGRSKSVELVKENPPQPFSSNQGGRIFYYPERTKMNTHYIQQVS